MRTLVKHLLAVASVANLAGCATVDFDYPKPTSAALDPAKTAETHLGRQVAGLASGKPSGESGFVLVSDGIDALAIRLLLAERAERTIDAQYYLLKNDITGRAFVRALLRAADRGVRVRLLLDDMFTGGYDAGMAGLDSHPNIEIRIFNPFASRSARAWDGITDFRRINRRMHNKSFTVDNQVTVIGGRNIADEYFGAREDAKFGDLDVLGIGPVVDDTSNMFDSYWNHERAAPVLAFAAMPDDPAVELDRVRNGLEDAMRQIINSPYAAAVQDYILNYIEADRAEFVWAPYSLAVDSPDKSLRDKANSAENITTALAKSLRSAEEEIIIISPYFVPMKSGVEILTGLQDGGVDISIITNSLAANNQATVHGGYAPSRKPLIRAGIKIYEVRSDAEVEGAQIVAASGAKATLHTKAFIVDRREIFIGSFNFDPRSANINTELGVIIHSPQIAAGSAERIDKRIDEVAYTVYLNENGKLRWRGMDNGEEVIWTKEPQTSWGQRFLAGFFRILPIRSQL